MKNGFALLVCLLSPLFLTGCFTALSQELIAPWRGNYEVEFTPREIFRSTSSRAIAIGGDLRRTAENDASPENVFIVLNEGVLGRYEIFCANPKRKETPTPAGAFSFAVKNETPCNTMFLDSLSAVPSLPSDVFICIAGKYPIPAPAVFRLNKENVNPVAVALLFVTIPLDGPLTLGFGGYFYLHQLGYYHEVPCLTFDP